MDRKRAIKDVPKIPSKKNKKVLSLEMKLDILRRFESGEKPANIARVLNLAPTTVRSICSRDATKIKALSEVTTGAQVKTTVITRSSLLVKMESLLSMWIEQQTQKHMPLSKMIIQAKARKFFNDLQDTVPLRSESFNENFNASGGWFERFKSRANLHNIHLKGEAASADHTAAKEFCKVFKDVVQEGGYTSKQIFNVDETGLFWKRLPKRTYISKEESAAPGYKVSKDRLTLLLGGNANGDYKLKPLLVYHSDNPRALKGINKKKLPVHWRANKKAWVTGVLFSDWVINCAIPEFKRYCEKENLNFKILVLLDNAPGHPTCLDEINPNVKFLFMPPNTTSIIQPMDQGVISNFKSYYLRRTFRQLITATDENEYSTIKDFWKAYNILNAIKNIEHSWAEIKGTCMNGVWRKIWPECAPTNADNEINEVHLVRDEIIELAQRANFEGMDEAGLEELINDADLSIPTQDLIEIAENIAEDSSSSTEEVVRKSFTTKGLAKAINLISEGLEIFRNEDPDEIQSSRVANEVNTSIGCYKAIYMQKKKYATQSTLDTFFKSQSKQNEL